MYLRSRSSSKSHHHHHQSPAIVIATLFIAKSPFSGNNSDNILSNSNLPLLQSSFWSSSSKASSLFKFCSPSSSSSSSSSLSNKLNHCRYFYHSSSSCCFSIPQMDSSIAHYSEAASDHHMGEAYTSGAKDSSSSTTSSSSQHKKPPPEADFVTSCPFKCLGLTRTASKEEVRINFLQLAKIHHPDVGGETKKFRRVNAAYKQSIEMIETGYAAKTAHKSETQSYQAPNERERNGEKTEGCVNEEEDARAKWRRKTSWTANNNSSGSGTNDTNSSSSSSSTNNKNNNNSKTNSSSSSSSNHHQSERSDFYTRRAENAAGKNKHADAKRTASFSSASTFANAERQEGAKRTADGTTYNYQNRSAYYNSFMAGEDAFRSNEFSNFKHVHERDENAKPHNTQDQWFKETINTSNFKTSSFNTSETHSSAREEKMNNKREQQSSHQQRDGFSWQEPKNANVHGYNNNFTKAKFGDFREERGHPKNNGGHHDFDTFYGNINSGYYGPKKRSRFDNIPNPTSPSSHHNHQNNNGTTTDSRKSNDEQQASYSDYGNGTFRHDDGAFRVFSTKKKPSSSSSSSSSAAANDKKNKHKFTNSFDGGGEQQGSANGNSNSSDHMNNNNNYENSSSAADGMGGGGSDGVGGEEYAQNSSSYHSRYEEYRRSQEETEREFGSDEGWFEFRENFFKKNQSITTRDLYRFRFSQATSAEEIDSIYTQAMNENVFSGYDIGEPLFLALERFHLGLGLGNKHLEKCFQTIDDWEYRTNRTAVALYYHVILKLYTNPNIMWLFPDLDSTAATEVVWKVLQKMQDKEVVDDACVGRSWWELLRLSCMNKGRINPHGGSNNGTGL